MTDQDQSTKINGEIQPDANEVDVNDVPGNINVTMNDEKLEYEIAIIKADFENRGIGLHAYENEMSYPEVLRQVVSRFIDLRREFVEAKQGHQRMLKINNQLNNQLEVIMDYLSTNHPSIIEEIQNDIMRQQQEQQNQQLKQQNQNDMDINDIANADMEDILNS